MSAAFSLVARPAAHDLSVLLGRASRLDEAGAVRLVADSGVLAVYVAVLAPRGLLDRSPTVLGLRTLALSAGAFDAVVPIRSLLARVDAGLAAVPDSEPGAPVPVGLPAEVSSIVWAGITPPRGGWQRLEPLDAPVLAASALAGIEEVATAIPTGTGEQIVHRARSEVWGRPLPGADHLPAGAAFALHALGFLGEDPVQQFAAGAWVRLSTQRGHVLVKQSGWTLQR